MQSEDYFRLWLNAVADGTVDKFFEEHGNRFAGMPLERFHIVPDHERMDEVFADFNAVKRYIEGATELERKLNAEAEAILEWKDTVEIVAPESEAEYLIIEVKTSGLIVAKDDFGNLFAHASWFDISPLSEKACCVKAYYDGAFTNLGTDD